MRPGNVPETLAEAVMAIFFDFLPLLAAHRAKALIWGKSKRSIAFRGS